MSLHAQSFDGLLQTRRPARGVTTAIHEPNSLEAAATLHVGRVVVERQKRGVFRVGVLPKLILDHAAFELKRPASVAICMRRMAADLGAADRKRSVEFRTLTMRRPGPDGWILQAASALPASATRWDCSRVTWQRGTNVVIALSEARLTVESSGRVVLSDPAGVRPELELVPLSPSPRVRTPVPESTLIP